MFHDNGAGIVEDLEMQIEMWIDKNFFTIQRQAFVYPPGQDSSGLEDADREMLGIQPNTDGWRVKIHAEQNTVEPAPLFDPLNPDFPTSGTITHHEILEVFPLVFNELVVVSLRTLMNIRAAMTESGFQRRS